SPRTVCSPLLRLALPALRLFDLPPPPLFNLFFFNAPATPAIYTLSLHDALPIFRVGKVQLSCALELPEEASSQAEVRLRPFDEIDRKSTRLNSSHVSISYAVFCLKKKKDEKYASFLSKSRRGCR